MPGPAPPLLPGPPPRRRPEAAAAAGLAGLCTAVLLWTTLAPTTSAVSENVRLSNPIHTVRPQPPHQWLAGIPQNVHANVDVPRQLRHPRVAVEPLSLPAGLVQSPGSTRAEWLGGACDAGLRAALLAAAALPGWRAVRRRWCGRWAMASTSDHPEGCRSSTLANLETLLGSGEEATPVSEPPVAAAAVPLPPSAADSPRDVPTDRPVKEVPNAKDVHGQLLSLLTEETIRTLQQCIPPEDVQRMRDEVLAHSGFRLTLAEDAHELSSTGVLGGTLFRGRISGNVPVVLGLVLQRTWEVFGDKYELLIIPEPARYDDLEGDASPDEKTPALLMALAKETAPDPLTATQYIFAAFLLLLSLGTTAAVALRNGLISLAFPQTRALLEADSVEDKLSVLDASLGPILGVALPVGLGVLACIAAQEAAQRNVARRHGVELSPPYLLPSMFLGSFGAVSRLRSLVPNKAALFDIAAAGPAAGAAVALALFVAGLCLTSSAANTDLALVPLPMAVARSSFLLGGLMKGLYGDVAIRCHPLVLAGWFGLIINALRTLPLGTTDGGRIMQTIVRQTYKQAASLLVLIALAFDVLAPGPGSGWGLLSAFFQSGPERKIRDQFTPLDPLRRNAGTAAILLAALLLVPMPHG
eukprot:EG_transcript_4933